MNRLGPDRRDFVHYDKSSGLADNTIVGILEDDEGRLWLATNHGLSRLDPQRGTFKSFDVDDGLQGSVFRWGSAFKSVRGEMFFGGSNGLNAFHPDRIEVDVGSPEVVLTDFLLFNESAKLRHQDPKSPLLLPIEQTEKIVLTHRDDVFAFEFAALHYAKPRHNRYAYRLEGFDRDWIPTGATKRYAQYTNLDPGDYTFTVKAAVGDGAWTETPTSIRVVVRPPLWRTWWAWVLYAVALLAAVALYLRRQERKIEVERARTEREKEINRWLGVQTAELERKNKELERFTYTVSHDLKSPLFTMKGFLGYVWEGLRDVEREQVKEDFRRIEEATQTMARLLDELQTLSRIGRQTATIETLPMVEVVRDAAGLVAGRLEERRVELVIDPQLGEVTADRLRLGQLIQNLVENGVKYMGEEPNPKIEIGRRRDGRETVFFVRDNGIGIATPYLEKVFDLFEQLDPYKDGTGIGLAICKQIVEVHDGRIWAESAGAGKGTTFCFTLPDMGWAEKGPVKELFSSSSAT